MATRNFMYDNRCVIVTEDDYGNGVALLLGDYVTHDRNYPKRLIKEFNFWTVVLTYGYYKDACIDYIEHPDRNPYDVMVGLIGYPATQKDFIQECKEVCGLSERQVRKICGNVGNDPIDYYIEQATEKMGKYMADKERNEVNMCINGLKCQYGLDECTCVATASNGEGFYELI